MFFSLFHQKVFYVREMKGLPTVYEESGPRGMGKWEMGPEGPGKWTMAPAGVEAIPVSRGGGANAKKFGLQRGGGE